MMSAMLSALALVGMPGGGKSTVGRHVARHLKRRFLDADAEVERRIGCPIRVFFEREGELRFRDRRCFKGPLVTSPPERCTTPLSTANPTRENNLPVRVAAQG